MLDHPPFLHTRQYVYSSQQRLSAAPVPDAGAAELRVAFPWQAYLARERENDISKSLTTRQKSSRLMASRTFVHTRSTTRWDKPPAPPSCRLIWTSGTPGEPIPASAPICKPLKRCLIEHALSMWTSFWRMLTS